MLTTTARKAESPPDKAVYRRLLLPFRSSLRCYRWGCPTNNIRATNLAKVALTFLQDSFRLGHDFAAVESLPHHLMHTFTPSIRWTLKERFPRR